MTEDELRALVRAAVTAHLSEPDSSRDSAFGARDSMAGGGQVRAHALLDGSRHVRDASHALFVLPATPDGTCLIEPAVACTHCGFCKSYGH